ncbi:MAG TPA: helix-turn-helix domain-containing protein [Pyrinomonadaceae bacterium]|jgi:transcriptional regulator with XRE-family HTH domain/pyrrolidone-carboxylate peptidase
MPEQKSNLDADPQDPQELRPIEEPPPGDDDPPPPPPGGSGVEITSVSPIAGSLVGRIEVTLTGTGFETGAEVFFGSSSSPLVIVDSSTSARAELPPASEAGSVSVSLVNPDGSHATREGGFTYITTEQSNRAEVLGVTPLSVIEDTETEVTIRGRNLIAAYNEGLVVLRGPTRVHLTNSSPTTERDEATGIEALTFTVRVVATPPLEPLERIAIQVLASRRPGAESDGIFESSRQMFTVLPRAIPVPLAFTDNLDPDKPNLVIVAGRNLEGCSLEMGDGAQVHLQKSDDRTLIGIVTVTEEITKSAATTESTAETPTTTLFIRSEDGSEVAQYPMSVAPSFEFAERSTSTMMRAPLQDEGAAGDYASSIDSDIGFKLTAVPNQQIAGPTEEDSAVFNLSGAPLSSFGFDWFNFVFTIFDITILIPIVNEVRLVPFFDSGGSDKLSTVPVLAQVGKLFRLRGMGLLVALHIDVIIHIRVVVIIGFRFDFWDFDPFNEFPELYPWGIGSLVVSVHVVIQIRLLISFLVALVQPTGKLHVLFFFHLRIFIDFTIDTDGRTFHFDPDFDIKVDYTKVSPLHNLFPCDGRFQLAEENGNTVFFDAIEAPQSYYFPRSAGECCLTWTFDLKLIRFGFNQPEEVIQERFEADFCLNAAPSPEMLRIFITSDPEPTGIPPTLEMDLGDTAILRALAQPVDESGNHTGPLQDVRDLGYDAEFYLEFPLDVLDPTLLPAGDAHAVQVGENVIHVRLWARDRNQVPQFAFWPQDIHGFDIARFIAEGLPPAYLGGALPVKVNPLAGKITIEPTVAYHDEKNGNRLVQTSLLERAEPFEDKPRNYVLAVKLTIPDDVPRPQTLTFTVTGVGMQPTQPLAGIPGGFFARGRTSAQKPEQFFTGNLAQKDQKGKIEIDDNTPSGELLAVLELGSTPTNVKEFSVVPNNKEDGPSTGTLTKFVPPGRAVGERDVKLSVTLKAESSRGTVLRLRKTQLDLFVTNEETFEEYLRVFQEVQEILTGSDTTYSGFAKSFYAELVKSGATSAVLKKQGDDLWKHAWTTAPTLKDDRPLYWARLQAIGALRAYGQRQIPMLTSDTVQQLINQFEWPSRGLNGPNGSIIFDEAPATATRKVIVTGFDPFQLPSQPTTSNPSGLIALVLNGRLLEQADPPVYIRTAVFPVRYKDFDENIVENAVTTTLSQIVLLLTTSLNDADYYDVERWACRARGGLMDNNRKVPDREVPGKEFYQSTLPYTLVITSDDQTRRLPGPNSATTPFVTDQSYKVSGAKGERMRNIRSGTIKAGEFRYEPLVDEEAAYKKQPDEPRQDKPSLEGSGWNYLSNEIFYRAARQRQTFRPSLASGHLHLALPAFGTQWSRDRLIEGVKEALRRFLKNIFPLRSAVEVTFPQTVINTTSQTFMLTATNETGRTIRIANAETTPPFSVQLPGPGPIILEPGAVLSLAVSFAPTTAGVYNSDLKVTDENGEVVMLSTLTSEAVERLPEPRITSFSPTSGRPGALVTILGENLDEATDVRIGGTSVPFTVVDASRLTATVTDEVFTGFIEVETPHGTAISSTLFRVVRRFPRELLSEHLRARRLELGLRQRDAAQQMGVKVGTYANWEQGRDEPRTRSFPAIIGFLGYDPSPEAQTLPERIREVREREGLSQRELAERLGVAPSTVKAWEADTVRRPTPRVTRIFEEYVKEA